MTAEDRKMIAIKDDLHKELKLYALLQDMTIQALIERFIKQGLPKK